MSGLLLGCVLGAHQICDGIWERPKDEDQQYDVQFGEFRVKAFGFGVRGVGRLTGLAGNF